ncbi:MAG: L-seryl-tRNA(Ser) seleniumtransferase, partial [Thermoleophilaceae bacterium]|nr:L-seryl-tRNA(Ser) seleniumtransferase [Thermoleophilaceae bacterium]
MASAAGSPGPGPDLNELLRSLPAVEVLAARLGDLPSRAGAVAAARAAIAARREALRAGGDAGDDPGGGDLEASARALYAAAERPSLRGVLNATGVIVHTGLGRAPLAEEAVAAAARAGGYSNLEYDLDAGGRGSRHSHVEPLLCELTGAEAAMAVNNCAAAVLLAAAALAGGRELVVSRGQLVEIGGSFRIPDVVAQSGARLVEVGTTNRTRASDYAAAIGSATGAVLRAHQSNFRTVGFVEEVEIEELVTVAG